MTTLSVVGHAQAGLVVTSKPKEMHQIHREFSSQVKLKTDEIIESIRLGNIAKALGLSVLLRLTAEESDRDAARTMELEHEIAFDSVQ
jgi:hypothetical protein